MSMQETKRPLSELEVRAIAGLSKVGGNNLKYLIDIASEKAPSAIYDLASLWLTNRGFMQDEADEISKAARWLAMVRRDYGEKVFQEVVGKIKAEDD